MKRNISVEDFFKMVDNREPAGKIIDMTPQQKPSFIDYLPNWLQTMSQEFSESYRTPQEIWATAFLSGISAAAGKRFVLKTGNYSNYPMLWLMIVGTSGSGKSDPFDVAFRYLSETDRDSYAKYQVDFQDWEALGRPGTPPVWSQTLISDVTPEALFDGLSVADKGLTLYRDELSGWFGDFGRYSKSGEIGHYLSIFGNSQFSVNRKGGRPLLISKPFLNVFGTIQPSVLQDVLSKNNAEASGFAQRFLYVFPDFQERIYQKNTNVPDIKPYNNLINSILRISSENEIYLSDEAETVYERFYNETEHLRVEADEFWAAAFSKAEVQILRLALTIKIARLPEAPTECVEKEDMECAELLMRYCIDSLKKFKAEQKTDLKKSEIIAEIFNENPEASHTDIASILNCSRQYVSKIYKKCGCVVAGCTNTKPFVDNDYRELEVQPI